MAGFSFLTSRLSTANMKSGGCQGLSEKTPAPGIQTDVVLLLLLQIRTQPHLGCVHGSLKAYVALR
jgi:hypothetical protein